MNMLLMNRLFSAAPMVFTCAGSYGREAQPRALYSRRPLNVKVNQRDDVTGKPEAIVRIAEGVLRIARMVDGGWTASRRSPPIFQYDDQSLAIELNCELYRGWR
jgi:hypothetical protein